MVFCYLYHLTELVFHWMTPLGQSAWAIVHFSVSVSVYGSSVGSYVNFILEVQHAAVCSGGCTYKWTFQKESQKPTQRWHPVGAHGEALSLSHPCLCWSVSATPWIRKPGVEKETNDSRNDHTAHSVIAKKKKKKSFAFDFGEAYAWEYSPAPSLDPNRTVPFMSSNELRD